MSTEYGLCRGCLIHVRENGTEDRPDFTQLQVALSGRLARQLRNLKGTLGYSPVGHATRSRELERQRRRRPRPPFSDHLVAPDQLILFDMDRDWSRVARLTADELPSLTPESERIAAEFTRVSRRQSRLIAPDPHRHRASLRALRIVLAWLGAAAPFHERDLRTLATLDRNISGQRVIWFLAERGLLEPDPARQIDRDARAVEKIIDQFPDPMRDELHAWIKVLKGEGRREHPPLSSHRIRVHLRVAQPVLEEWAEHTNTLRSITIKEFKKVLDTRKPGAARAVHQALRSLFQGLRQERVIFRDPTRGVTLPGVVTLPASVPSDRLAGLMEQARTPQHRLLLALVAIHAVTPTQAAQLHLADVDLTRGELIIRHRYHRRSVYLDPFTVELLTDWLRERQQTWPTSANPHLLVTSQTALDIAQPPVSDGLLQHVFEKIGIPARTLWQDRVLHEAQLTSDPVHLMRLFGIAAETAMQYVRAAYPEKTGRPTAR
ncbi:hypothetical protein [Streptomyces sp. NPDC057694]|uniref:hypothetical protein n=1 Tax=Streptomyces sp. NPDC057694 TaxID=3346216 RepID=UPI003683F165